MVSHVVLLSRLTITFYIRRHEGVVYIDAHKYVSRKAFSKSTEIPSNHRTRPFSVHRAICFVYIARDFASWLNGMSRGFLYPRHDCFNTINSLNGTMRPTPTAVRTRQLGNYICSCCTNQLRRQRRSHATISSSTKPSIYDVVCVGGGPAGLSLLAALRTSPAPN